MLTCTLSSCSDEIHSAPKESRPSLTPRQLQTIRLIADGHSNKIIADMLGFSQHTAKYHVKQVVSKLGCTTRAAAAVTAIRMGLI